MKFPVVSGNVLVMNDDRRAFARQFAIEQMARLGMNRAELGAKAKLSPKTLRAFLDGHRWPQADTREAISLALEWPADEIDHIAATGEHRFTAPAIDYVTREPLPDYQGRVKGDSSELTRLFGATISFGHVVMEQHPALQEEAGEFIASALDLYKNAIIQETTQQKGEGHDSPATSQVPEAGPANQPAAGLSVVSPIVGDAVAADQDEDPDLAAGEAEEPDTP